MPRSRAARELRLRAGLLGGRRQERNLKRVQRVRVLAWLKGKSVLKIRSHRDAPVIRITSNSPAVEAPLTVMKLWTN